MVIKVNAIDTKVQSTSGLVSKIQYDSDKQSTEKRLKISIKACLILAH